MWAQTHSRPLREQQIMRVIYRRRTEVRPTTSLLHEYTEPAAQNSAQHHDVNEQAARMTRNDHPRVTGDDSSVSLIYSSFTAIAGNQLASLLFVTPSKLTLSTVLLLSTRALLLPIACIPAAMALSIRTAPAFAASRPSVSRYALQLGSMLQPRMVLI